MHRCGTKENLEPDVVKVDERNKLFLTTQRFTFSYLNGGIILRIQLPWPANPANTYARNTETLDSCFVFIRSHQQLKNI